MNASSMTEMGRRLFPHFNVLIDNLHPSAMYDVYVDLIERGRYIWAERKWIKTNDASTTTADCECVQQHQAYLHRDSPNLGRLWMASPVSFAHLKLTSCAKAPSSAQVGSNK
jgi:hypothetical protein